MLIKRPIEKRSEIWNSQTEETKVILDRAQFISERYETTHRRLDVEQVAAVSAEETDFHALIEQIAIDMHNSESNSLNLILSYFKGSVRSYVVEDAYISSLKDIMPKMNEVINKIQDAIGYIDDLKKESEREIRAKRMSDREKGIIEKSFHETYKENARAIIEKASSHNISTNLHILSARKNLLAKVGKEDLLDELVSFLDDSERTLLQAFDLHIKLGMAIGAMKKSKNTKSYEASEAVTKIRKDLDSRIKESLEIIDAELLKEYTELRKAYAKRCEQEYFNL